jgi:hypothetical protein
MRRRRTEKFMKHYGVYTRTSDLQAWKLEKITTLDQAHIEEEFNSQFGVLTLIAGPLSFFPKFVET